MQLTPIKHFGLFLVGSLLMFLLNGLPIGFDLDRAGVTLWFIYPTVVWGFAVFAH